MWGLTGVTLADGLGSEEEVAGSQGGVGRAVGGTVGGHGEGDDEGREGGVGNGGGWEECAGRARNACRLCGGSGRGNIADAQVGGQALAWA